ncbi:MAG: transcription antitermination factor NusB [Acidobacteria bacterium]|nr:transcription antitermination factor NusB [Acidobacteriota bacterium]
MASRTKARQCALQMLYQWDLGKDSPETVEQLFWLSAGTPPEKAPEKSPKKAAKKTAAKETSKLNPKTDPKLNLKKTPKKASPPNEDDPHRSFANRLFAGTVDAVEEIDCLIRHRAEHWRLERMAVVDRNILRLGIYELCHHRETPPGVVINEALEIARKFSGEESVQFINGLLDQIRKDVASNQPA